MRLKVSLVLALLLASAVPALDAGLESARADGSSPVITNVSVPTTVDAAAGEKITVTATVTDDSALTSVSAEITDGGNDSQSFPMTPVADEPDTYSYTYDPHRWSTSEQRAVYVNVDASDDTGYAQSEGHQVTVTSKVDRSRPKLRKLWMMSSDPIDVHRRTQRVTIFARLTDVGSGVREVNLRGAITQPGGRGVADNIGSATLVSGTRYRGVWAQTVAVRPNQVSRDGWFYAQYLSSFDDALRPEGHNDRDVKGPRVVD